MVLLRITDIHSTTALLRTSIAHHNGQYCEGVEKPSGGLYRHRFLTPSALSKRGASGRGASGGNPFFRQVVDLRQHSHAFPLAVSRPGFVCHPKLLPVETFPSYVVWERIERETVSVFNIVERGKIPVKISQDIKQNGKTVRSCVDKVNVTTDVVKVHI